MHLKTEHQKPEAGTPSISQCGPIQWEMFITNLSAMLGSSILKLASFFFSMEVSTTEWKERILANWDKSRQYPRKKKKKIRKHLILDWTFASYEPFTSFSEPKKNYPICPMKKHLTK